MKKIWLIIIFNIVAFSISAQHNISVRFQGDYLLNRPKNIDVKSAGAVSFSYGYLFDFKGEWNISPQLSFVSSQYIMDGLFFDNAGNRTFEVTPNNYKQSTLNVYSLRLPIIINKKVIGDNKNALFLGFGPYFEYHLNATQSYKVGNDKFKNTAPIDNNFQFGLQYELGIKKSSQLFKNGIYLSFGMSYQMSDLLNQNESYNLLASFAKCGVLLN